MRVRVPLSAPRTPAGDHALEPPELLPERLAPPVEQRLGRVHLGLARLDVALLVGELASRTSCGLGTCRSPDCYDVSILAAGYQCQGQLQQIAAEGVLVVNATAGWDYDTYAGGTQAVTVSDGRLTLSNGPSAALNCIDSIQIRAH